MHVWFKVQNCNSVCSCRVHIISIRNISRRMPKALLSQMWILLYVPPQKVSRFAPCCPGGCISFKQSHWVGTVIAPLWEVLPHGHTILCLYFLQSRQLYPGSDWALAVRSSWPFRWSPCGPIRLAGLHSVKHESVRHRKLHPFQKMSNSSGRSLLALYCDIILKNLGRGWHMSCGWPGELWFAFKVLVQINKFDLVHKIRHFEEVKRTKCVLVEANIK